LNTKAEVGYLIYMQRMSQDLAGLGQSMNRLIEVEDKPANSHMLPGQLPAATVAQFTSADRLPSLLVPLMTDAAKAEDLLMIWSAYVRLLAREPAKTPALPVASPQARPAAVAQPAQAVSRQVPGAVAGAATTVVNANGTVTRVTVNEQQFFGDLDAGDCL